MLKDIRELGKDLKKYFSEITDWPEIAFNKEDKEKLLEIDNTIKVLDHSIIFQIDTNHIIVPGQYILYAVFMKEFAVGLRQHLDVFDKFKLDKSANDVGSQISTKQFNLENQSLDSWSTEIALKPLTDKEYNFDAKSIINGDPGNYRVRGTTDFFTSVILKIINVPDASSAILGKIIYNLSGNIELYNYLEKRFYRKLQFLVKEKNANRFAYKVFSYLFQYDDLNKLKAIIVPNYDINFKSIKTGDYSLTSIFKISENLQTDEELTTGGKIRFFGNPIYLAEDTNEFYYFSTEWTYGTNSRLDIETLISILKIYYPEFTIVHENGAFILRAIDAPIIILENDNFELLTLIDNLAKSGLQYNKELVTRFLASLLTKPFVILTGLSGSGKTKLAQAFVQWICHNESQYCIVPVGADWTNREPLLGYPNALNPKEYVKPDSGILDLIIQAENNPELPHFIILDEMNLSHVERYFADFLSVMESKEEIPLHASAGVENGVPEKLIIPSNLFIIGTVNIDETTNMFSPKVLDRANTIEFRISEKEMKTFLGNIKPLDLDILISGGASMAKSFLQLSEEKSLSVTESSELVNNELVKFFGELKKTGAEFGYRSASEMLQLMHQLDVLDSSLSADKKLDIMVMQKLLPKLHGSRRKLCPVLETLAGFCVNEGIKIQKDIFENDSFDFNGPQVKYSLSLEKITRMYKNAVDNGYASFAEA